MTRVIWNLKTESRVFLFVYRWIHGRVWNVSVKYSQSAEKTTGEVFFEILDYRQDQSVTSVVVEILQKKKNIVVLYWHELQLTFIHWESRDLLTLKTIKNMLTVHAFILTPHGPKYVDTQTQVWSCFSKTIDLSPLLQTQVHPWCPALTLGDRAHALHSWWWMWCGTSAKPNWETFIMAQVCAWRRCCCSETGRGLPQAAHDCWKYYCML